MQLQQWSKQWDLPSLSTACTHVEAYMRFADLAFTVQECDSVAISPSGVLPTLDTSEEVVGPGKVDQTIDGEDSAKRILAHLKTVKDLDAGLSPEEFGEVQAFSELARSKLVPATIYFTFLDPIMFKKHTQGAYAATLPTPLNRITPWSWRTAVAKSYGNLTASQVIADVEMVYSILDNRLEGRDYFVAGRPTSIDALLYAHLNYHRYAPVGEIDLRPVLGKYKAIAKYLEFIRSKHWKGQPKPPPVFQPTEEEKREAAAVREVKNQSWSEWFYGSGRDVTSKTKRTEKEIRFKRRSQIFMGFMASAVAVYVLLSDVAGIEFYDSDDEEEDDENDIE